MLIDFDNPIGNNIRKWRTLKGFKQLDLAKQIGVSKTTLSKIENDTQQINLPRMKQIADVLNIKITHLFIDPMDLLSPHEKSENVAKNGW